MLDALKGLFTSKKFWLSTILAPVALGIAASVLPILGVSPELTSTLVQWLAGILGTGVLGIGLADFGKEAQRLKKKK